MSAPVASAILMVLSQTARREQSHAFMAPLAWLLSRVLGAHYWLQAHGTDIWSSRRSLVRRAIVTCGRDGIVALDDDGFHRSPAYTNAHPIINDTAAGDAAQAALVDRLIAGAPMDVALRAAARNGFEACLSWGVGSLTRTEMYEYLQSVDSLVLA